MGIMNPAGIKKLIKALLFYGYRFVKILFISSFYLYKDTRFGGSKRLYSIADKLAEDHELHLIHFDGCYELDDYDSLPPTGFDTQLFIR